MDISLLLFGVHNNILNSWTKYLVSQLHKKRPTVIKDQITLDGTKTECLIFEWLEEGHWNNQEENLKRVPRVRPKGKLTAYECLIYKDMQNK